MKDFFRLFFTFFLGFAFCVGENGTNDQNICGGVFSGYQYQISSPNYPEDYSNNRDCLYILHGEELNDCDQEFHLQFLNFTLEFSENCQKDFLRIGDANIYCGNIAGIRKFKGKKSILRVLFHSDAETSAKGFKILITPLACSESQVHPDGNSSVVSVKPEAHGGVEEEHTEKNDAPVFGTTFRANINGRSRNVENEGTVQHSSFAGEKVSPDSGQDGETDRGQKSRVDPEIRSSMVSRKTEEDGAPVVRRRNFNLEPTAQQSPFTRQRFGYEISRNSRTDRGENSYPVYRPDVEFSEEEDFESGRGDTPSVRIESKEKKDDENVTKRLHNFPSNLPKAPAEHLELPIYEQHHFHDANCGRFESEHRDVEESGSKDVLSLSNLKRTGNESRETNQPRITSYLFLPPSPVGNSKITNQNENSTSNFSPTVPTLSLVLLPPDNADAKPFQSVAVNNAASSSTIVNTKSRIVSTVTEPPTEFVVPNLGESKPFSQVTFLRNQDSKTPKNEDLSESLSISPKAEQGLFIPSTHYGVPENTNTNFDGDNRFDPLSNTNPKTYYNSGGTNVDGRTNCDGRTGGNFPNTGVVVNTNYDPLAGNRPNTNNYPNTNFDFTPGSYPSTNYGPPTNNFPNTNTNFGGSGTYPNTNTYPGTNDYPNTNTYLGTNNYPNTDTYPNSNNYPGTNIYPNTNNYPTANNYPNTNCDFSFGIKTNRYPNMDPKYYTNTDSVYTNVYTQNSQCCNAIYSSQKFLIASPGFPSLIYSSNTNECQFTIQRYSTNICQIKLNFKFFYLGSDDQFCAYGYLELDGQRICGCKTGQSIVSSFENYSTKIITMKYLGYPRTKFNGFLIEVVQESCTNSYSRSASNFRRAERFSNSHGTQNVPHFEKFFTRGKRSTSGSDSFSAAGVGTNRTKLIESSHSDFRNAIDDSNFNSEVESSLEKEEQRKTSNLNETDNDSKSSTLQIRRIERDTGYSYRKPGFDFDTGRQNKVTVSSSSSTNENLFWNTCKALTFFKWTIAAKEVYLQSAQCSQSGSSRFVVPIISIFPAIGSGSINPTANCENINVVQGTVSSPLYPSNYASNLNQCYRFYKAPGYCQLELAILDFDLESSTSCSKDYMSFSGQNRRYCGTTLSGSHTIFDMTRTNSAEMYFVSDSSGSGRGFRAGFSQILC